MFKSFIVEFVLTAPLLVAVAYICVKLLQKEMRFTRPGKVTAVISLGLITAFMITRAMPFAAFKIAPPPNAGAVAGTNNPLERKNEFLKILDALSNDQSKLTKEVKTKIFDQYKDLFPNGEKDKQIYYENLNAFVDCNMAYFQDALDALKTKKNQKSEMRKKCQEMSGLFFNRAKLIPEEQAKLNDQVIETIAKGKKILQDNKEVEINEGVLKQALEVQARSKETLKLIFAEAP